MNDKSLGADAAAVDVAGCLVPASTASHVDRDLGLCLNCDTALAMCVYWKMHGYVACCPECKHTSKVENATPPLSEASGSVPSEAQKGS